MQQPPTSIEQQIRRKLMAEFAPIHMELENESSQHHRDPEGETHFKLLLVSSAFEGQSRVQRQQQVQALLSEERAQGLHALSLRTMTPSEWEKNQNLSFETPNCVSGTTSKANRSSPSDQ